MRLFEKNIHLHQQPHTKNLGPDRNMFLENNTLFGDYLFKVFQWRCIKRGQLDQVTFTTDVT